MDDRPPVDTPASPPKAPRWVKLFAITMIVVVLIVVVALVAGGGGKHGPGRHQPGGGNGEHKPPAQYGP